MTMRRGLAAALALGLAALSSLTVALALAGCQAPAASPPPRRETRAVSVVRVELRPISGGLVTSGVLTPRQEVAVSADLAGYRVAKVLVDEGAWVKAGQPLAVMDTSILDAQLAQQRALLVEQEDTARQRQAEAARVSGLEGKGVLSEEQLQARTFAAEDARAAVGAQAAAVQEMATRLAHLTVRAPVAGLVIQRSVRPGDISGGTTPWFRIAQNGRIELWADVAEADFAQIRKGLDATVTLADDAKVAGTVRLISPRVDSTSRLGTVRIALPVRPDIRAGGFAKATFVDRSRAVPALPESAIRYDADGASVMVVGPHGRVRQQPVRTGERGGGWVELLVGPPPGSVVVAKAAAQLLPGDYVAPVWEQGGGAAR
ncbi:MAG TPA: efflux RND transporter periplasmic adaptor subunit [Caulobacteraceae bacterium]|nr:efflux RND transporter periplasmic adaptor subunit [Caulobacteraceae bacterium]